MTKINRLFLMVICAIACVGVMSSCAIFEKNNSIIDKSIDMSERLITIGENIDSVEVANMVSPAVVGITSSQNGNETVGSGVCVAADGYVLTNAHVIANDNSITLHLFNGNIITSTLLFKDTSLDIAILKASSALPYLPLEDVDDIAVGEDVLAVGTPISLLLKHTFTKGIVSALNRTLRVSGSSGDTYMQNLIQHDASLNSGNSGGPLLNATGKVIGINTLKINSSEGLGFAIPVKSFRSLLASFAENINYTTPYLGAFGYDAEIAAYYQKTKLESGVFLESVDEFSPLHEIGMRASDVIVSINGNEIKNVLDLRHILYSLKPQEIVSIDYSQNGQIKSAKTALDPHPENNKKEVFESSEQVRVGFDNQSNLDDINYYYNNDETIHYDNLHDSVDN